MDICWNCSLKLTFIYFDNLGLTLDWPWIYIGMTLDWSWIDIDLTLPTFDWPYWAYWPFTNFLTLDWPLWPCWSLTDLADLEPNFLTSDYNVLPLNIADQWLIMVTLDWLCWPPTDLLSFILIILIFQFRTLLIILILLILLTLGDPFWPLWPHGRFNLAMLLYLPFYIKLCSPSQ